MHGLRDQAHMPAHRHAAFRNETHCVGHQRAAFQFHHLRAGGHQARRTAHRLLAPFLVAAERQVTEDERALGAAHDAFHVVGDVLQLYGQRGVPALDHHAERVADQQGLHAGVVQDARKAGVIGREHGDPGLFAVQAREIAQGKSGHGALPPKCRQPPLLKNSRRLRIVAMRCISRSRSAGRSTKFRFSEFTISTGAEV